MADTDTKNVFDMSLPATREDLKQLANLQMEFKKELDMMKEGHMDLAKRIYHLETSVSLLNKIERLQEENSELQKEIMRMSSRAAQEQLMQLICRRTSTGGGEQGA